MGEERRGARSALPERRDVRIAETLTFELLVAVNRLARAFREQFGRELEIGLPEWRCVMALAAWPGSSGEEVGRRMAMDRMTVSRSLRRLEAAGRAARRPDPGDQRRAAWHLTEAGWTVFDRITPSALARDEAAFADLTPDERRLVRRVLSGISAYGNKAEASSSSPSTGDTGR